MAESVQTGGQNPGVKFPPNGNPGPKPPHFPPGPQLDRWDQAITNNQIWSAAIRQKDPNYFPELAKEQKPQILWFGCADSRVPETSLLGLGPGDVFVHRSVANIVRPWELSQASVLAYAVEHLENKQRHEHYIRDIVICGHTNCGGCAADFSDSTDEGGPIDGWLVPLRVLKEQLVPEWEKQGVTDLEAQKLLLVEANIKGGVEAVKRSPLVAKGIQERGLQVHGAIYNLSTGKIKELLVL